MDTPANPGEPRPRDTILVVDDDPQPRVLMNSLLADDLGHELVFAPDGEAGIARYEQTHPDWVITDLVMPRLSGILMIEHLKTIHPTAKMIAVSGRGSERLTRAKAAGALATLAKPIQRDELVSALKEALAGPEPWKEWG